MSNQISIRFDKWYVRIACRNIYWVFGYKYIPDQVQVESFYNIEVRAFYFGKWEHIRVKRVIND